MGLNQAIVFPFASFLLLLIENSPKAVLWAEGPSQHSLWSNPHLQLGWGVLTHSYIYNDERTCAVNSSSSVLPSWVGLGYLSKDQPLLLQKSSVPACLRSGQTSGRLSVACGVTTEPSVWLCSMVVSHSAQPCAGFSSQNPDLCPRWTKLRIEVNPWPWTAALALALQWPPLAGCCWRVIPLPIWDWFNCMHAIWGCSKDAFGPIFKP